LLDILNSDLMAEYLLSASGTQLQLESVVTLVSGLNCFEVSLNLTQFVVEFGDSFVVNIKDITIYEQRNKVMKLVSQRRILIFTAIKEFRKRRTWSLAIYVQPL